MQELLSELWQTTHRAPVVRSSWPQGLAHCLFICCCYTAHSVGVSPTSQLHVNLVRRPPGGHLWAKNKFVGAVPTGVCGMSSIPNSSSFSGLSGQRVTRTISKLVIRQTVENSLSSFTAKLSCYQLNYQATKLEYSCIYRLKIFQSSHNGGIFPLILTKTWFSSLKWLMFNFLVKTE